MIGKINEAVVVRETQIGYMLKIGDDEVFLHYNECCEKKLLINQKVDAFVYLDKKNRIAATLENPTITIEQPGFGTVVAKKDFGVFINIGISKDILISSDDLPVNVAIWPNEKDKILVILKIVRDRLVAKPLLKKDIERLKRETLEEDKKYFGYVYRISNDGINVVTKNYNIVFIYYKNLRKEYRLGEKLEFKVLKNDVKGILGTTIENKEIQIIDDAKILYKYMLTHNDVLNFTEKTDPDIIYRVFKMSKSAFKKAIGYLYKRELISILDDKIILIKGDYEFED
ncbi:MAG: S1-like domain-containing RNA-binding protein [Bacilli bacterium]